MRFHAFLQSHREHAEELEERAAIMEYDGGLPRSRAETMAMLRIMDKYALWRNHEHMSWTGSPLSGPGLFQWEGES